MYLYIYVLVGTLGPDLDQVAGVILVWRGRETVIVLLFRCLSYLVMELGLEPGFPS